jgi:hypothetical protein
LCASAHFRLVAFAEECVERPAAAVVARMGAEVVQQAGVRATGVLEHVGQYRELALDGLFVEVTGGGGYDAVPPGEHTGGRGEDV